MQGVRHMYRWLLKLYPARFREEYGVPMERQFWDEYSEAHTPFERAALWLHAIGDLALSAPGQLLHEFTLDVKHAVRIYQKRWSTTTLAVLALGLAIGATTGLFSVLNALLLRSLPFSHPAQLTELYLSPFTGMRGRNAFREWAGSSLYLQSAATFSSSEMNVVRTREAFRVKALETSANLFQVLGVEAAAGRTFAPEEDSAGHSSVAVISFGLWQQFFAGSPEAIGAPLQVNGAPVTVIGVAPASFDYPGKTDIWLPTAFDFEKIPKRGAFIFQTIGRLRPGVSLGKARNMFEADVLRANPKSFDRLHADDQNRPHLASLQDQLAGPVRQGIWVLAGLSLLVLLTACANIAQLLISRATERREELELRAALGASRARLLQQLIVEASVLTVTGAVLGVVVAQWTAWVASSVVPPQLATQQYTVLDWRVLAFAAGLAFVMGVVFGVLPAWLIGRLQPSGHIVRTQISVVNAGTTRIRAGLLALQAALTLCLVMSSWSMGTAFLRLLSADLGFRPASVVTLNVSIQGTRPNGAGEWSYYREALERIRALPGVAAAGAVGHLPLVNSVYMAGSCALDSGQKVSSVLMNAVTPGYFLTMGTGFTAGRDFTASSGSQLNRSVVVNQAFADATGLGSRIMGRKVIPPWSRDPYAIEGVVRTESIFGPAYPGSPQIYWQIQEEPPAALTFVASVRGKPESYLPQVRDTVHALNSQIPVYDVMTLDQRLTNTLSRPRVYTVATFFLAVLALLLAAVGSYGGAAYSVAQRTREMGIRMALGASYSSIRRMMIKESLLPIACGAVTGVFLSLVFGQYLEHLLDSAQRPTLLVSAGVGMFLLITGLLTVWTATNRILLINPSDALRAE